MKNKLIAVILAAGKGTRMHPFSVRYPKPSLPICNKPVIQYQIEMFRDLGITDIIIVIGHLGHEIALRLGDGRALGVSLRYVEQTSILGIAAALGQLESHADSPLFLALGDIFFKAGNVGAMVERMRVTRAGAVLAVKREKDPEAVRRNFTVAQDADGRVTRVIEKPRHVDTDIKGCGLYLFDLPVFEAVRRTPRTAMRDEYEITDTIQIMVDDGLPVYTEEVVEWDVNLTFPSDVLTCNLFELDHLGIDHLVGSDTTIHPGAQLHNTVIGDRVTIEHPIVLRNCVVFSGTTVTTKSNLENFVITDEHQIDCRMFANSRID